MQGCQGLGVSAPGDGSTRIRVTSASWLLVDMDQASEL